MIDIHCHVFNARSLPILGVLRSRKIWEPLARLLTEAVLFVAADDNSLDASVGKRLPARSHAAGNTIGSSDTGTFTSEEEAIRYVVSLIPSTELLGKAGDGAIAQLPATFRASLDVTDAAWVGHKRPSVVQNPVVVLKGRRDAIANFLIESKLGLESPGEIWRLILAMCKSERELFRSLSVMCPEVELFVHLMMDMQKPYWNIEPKYLFDRQIRRMRRLQAEMGGKLIGFVAFDPFRKNSLEWVEGALKNGFCGIKFYPPSGYRPIDNQYTPTNPPLDGNHTSAKTLNDRCDRLFQSISDGQVPMIAHCTPHGMERRPEEKSGNKVVLIGTGTFADPLYWEGVLHKYPSLRLSLAHTGDDDPANYPPHRARGWFAENDADFEDSFAGRAVRLCLRYENVFCDLADFGSLFDPALQSLFQRRMEKVVESNPLFATKIMYGSDFPMTLPGQWDKYLPIVRDVFLSSPVLSPHWPAISRGNALRFLNLSGFLRRSGVRLTSLERRLLSKLISPMPTARETDAATLTTKSGRIAKRERI